METRAGVMGAQPWPEGGGEAEKRAGEALLAEGQAAAALLHYSRALEPGGAGGEWLGEVHHGLARALAALGRAEEAIGHYVKALERNPRSGAICVDLGRAAAGLGNREAAEALFRQAIALRDQEGRAYCELGGMRLEQGQFVEAAASFRMSLERDAAGTRAWLGLAGALAALGQPEGSLAAYMRLLELDPEAHEARLEAARVAGLCGRQEEAFALLREAIAREPESVRAHTQMGMLEQDHGRMAQAIASLTRALELDPGDGAGLRQTVRSSLAGARAQMGDRAGLRELEALVEEQPCSAQAHWRLGEALLLHGEYARGWKEYEWRTRVERLQGAYGLSQERAWAGEPLEGKTILLYAEQGMGDVLQFARYVPHVAALGATVVLEVQPGLRGLLRELGGVKQCIEQGAARRGFDVCAPLMSLPALLGERVAEVPAPAAVGVWRGGGRRRAGEPLRVGLTWAGSGRHERDRLRSTRLEQWRGLAEVGGVCFTSLQAEAADGEMEREGARFGFIDSCAGVRDFGRTAEMIAALDLVITVDTAVAHLAGSMGAPVWILVPIPPDWRWGLAGSTSAWYPSARLFRQAQAGEWPGVLAEVAAELRALVMGACDERMGVTRMTQLLEIECQTSVPE